MLQGDENQARMSHSPLELLLASEPLKIQELIRFGEDYELDPGAYELRRASRALKLERIPMEILLLLLEQKGQLVTREQIVKRIWGDGIFLDTDNSINGAIRKIRQVLRDDSDNPRFIQTVTGRGYRFVAVCVTDAQDRVTLPAVAQSVPPLPTQPQAEIRRHNLNILPPSLVIGILLIAVATAYFLWIRPHVQLRSASGRQMLAVLPFENLTGDASQEYFSDGLTEKMISQLGNLDPQHLGVIARTSVMHYKGNQTPLEQIGHELGVQYVIEGSVRRDANKVRITAQLIQTKDQTHIWARKYDRELKGLLTLQDEIARQVAAEIQLTLVDRKPAAPLLSASQYEGYDLYLKGQYFLDKRNVSDLDEAIGYFQRALSKNPKDARAYAGLADAYSLMAGYSSRPQGEFVSRARASALKALEIDDRLPEAHAALALIVQNNDWDWQTAEKEFRRAIELNPNYATAHHWYAEHLMWRGRFDEALQESERARQLDPLSLIIAADNGAILFFSRQYDLAVEKFRSVLEVDPDFPRAHLVLRVLVEKGNFVEARSILEEQRNKMATPWYWCNLAHIYGRSGQATKARDALHELLTENQHKTIDARIVAAAYAALGDKEQTLAWLERAYIQHSNELTALKVDPGYDFLRGDPRFQDLLQRVGLAD